jgi:hypothetical protein
VRRLQRRAELVHLNAAHLNELAADKASKSETRLLVLEKHQTQPLFDARK